MVRLIEAYGHEVVATAATGPETLAVLRRHRPDVSVVDVRMPPTQSDEGLRAALAARAEVPGLPVLILSQHVEQLYARELLADGTGAVGYLLKESVFDAERRRQVHHHHVRQAGHHRRRRHPPPTSAPSSPT